jgi:DNA-directed RNA polymerase specialized sigma24 family protein
MDPAGFATNLSTWLISRLRGYYYREYAHRPTQTAPRVAGREYDDVLAALAELRAQQREALVLVEGIKFSSGEAARICRQPPGRFTTLLEGARADLARHLAKGGSGGAEAGLGFARVARAGPRVGLSQASRGPCCP